MVWPSVVPPSFRACGSGSHILTRRESTRWPWPIGTEGRIKHAQNVRAGHSDILKASTSGRPTSTSSATRAGDAARKPTAKIPSSRAHGRSFVTGMQGDDPRYYRVISHPNTSRCIAVLRARATPRCHRKAKHDELDTYLPAFAPPLLRARPAA